MQYKEVISSNVIQLQRDKEPWIQRTQFHPEIYSFHSCSQLSYWNQWPLPSQSLTFSLLLDAFVKIPPSKNYMYFPGRALGKFLAWITFDGLKKSYNENKIWASWCGGFNPEKNMLVKLDHFPQVGVKIKNTWNHHLPSDKLTYLAGKSTIWRCISYSKWISIAIEFQSS